MATRKRPVTPEEEAAKEARKQNMEAIGQRLVERRKICDMSQEVVVRRVKDYGLYIQRTTYGHYENGIIEMDATALIAVSRALKTTVAYLLGLDMYEAGVTPDANVEWFGKLRAVAHRIPTGRGRSLFQQHILDFTEAEAAYALAVDPHQNRQRSEGA